MKFLIAFITKEKQTESLVDKLCKRVAEAGEVRQWRDVAFCISQLTFTDRCLKKLVELFPLYKDRLADEEVRTASALFVSLCQTRCSR